MRLAILVVILLGGCRQILGLDDLPAKSDDAGTDDAPQLADAFIPDAGLCMAASAECVGPVLRVCNAVGQLPVDTACSWDCIAGPTPHCGELQPAGGAVQPTDLVPTDDLADVVITAGATTTIDSDTGEITNVRVAGAGIRSGIDFTQRGNVGVLRFKSLVVDGSELRVVGGRALAIVSLGPITVDAQIRASCAATIPGPGGFSGGNPGGNGNGSGGGGRGQGNTDKASGGGGGGYGAIGGRGGAGQGEPASLAGVAYGMETIPMLFGGSGGGGGGGAGGGAGGAGGGAIQLVANGTIRIAQAGIAANGCGGKQAASGGGGGGGGAGGTILIEAPSFELAANTFLVVNGGGGAGSRNGTDGADGQNDATAATGGNGGPNGGADGGKGGAGVALPGQDGLQGQAGGGGGGGVGRIRINTLTTASAQLSSNAILSPGLGASSSTTTLGIAAVQ